MVIQVADFPPSVVCLINVSDFAQCCNEKTHVLPPLICPVNLIPLGTVVVDFQASLLHSVQLGLAPFPYVVFCHF
jgi:hypothetical protein